MRKILMLSMMFVFFVSCAQQDVENLNITGVVKDETTNEVVSLKATEFKIECWKKANSNDESYGDFERLKMQTNTEGQFSVQFDKGSLIIFIVKAEGYQKYVKKLYLKESNNTVELKLKPLVSE